MQKKEVLAPLEEFFKDHLPNVLMGMRLAERADIFPEATVEERKLELFLNVAQGQNFSQSKAQFKKWILLKGMEDIHTSIGESLRLMLMYERIKRDNPMSSEEINKMRKLHYPSLIEKIQEVHGETFSHKKELLSLNKIRNALLHDNGIAVSTRLEEGEEKLTLYGARAILFWQDNERRVPMKIGEPSPPNTPLMMSAEKFQIEFAVGSSIELSLKQFVDVVWTSMFIKSDIEVMLNSLEMVEA